MSAEPQAIVDAALAASDADGCVVLVTDHTEANLRWANTTLTTNGRMATRAVTVVSTFAKSGGASAGILTRAITDIDDVPELVRAAEKSGRDADVSEDAARLVEPDSDASRPADWDCDPEQTGVEVFDAFARGLGAEFRSWQAAGRRLFGFAEHQLTSSFLGSSTGLRRRVDQPTGRVEINGKDAESSAWVGVHTRDFADVDVAAVAADLERRLSWARRSVELPAGRYDTILPPPAVADLMVYLLRALDARAAVEGRSVFSAPGGGTRLGERVTGLPLSLRSDPSHPGLQCAAVELPDRGSWTRGSVFDAGRPVGPTSWIDGGVLRHLVGTRAWSARAGEPAGPAVDNLILDGAPDPVGVAEMIAGTGRGLLLTCLWYIREVDPQTLLLTGLTRDGVYLIEDGEVTGAVNNFRFNESPVDLLARATQASEARPALSREWSDYFSRSAMPALRIPDFNMSTVSRAR